MSVEGAVETLDAVVDRALAPLDVYDVEEVESDDGGVRFWISPTH